jgi:hypothetical protein
VLRGNGLHRITGIDAEGVQFSLEAPQPGGQEREVRISTERPLERDTTLDLRMAVLDYGEPIVLPDGLRVAAPKPIIENAELALPPDLQVSLKPRELPAGIQMSAMVRMRRGKPDASVILKCRNVDAPEIEVPAGGQVKNATLRSIDANTLFLSFDPALWPSGCQLTAALVNGREGRSDPFELGRVVRMPRIDQFQLTDEAVDESSYAGVVTGRDLELVEKAGWDASNGHPVLGLPTPIAGEGHKQSLRLKLPWPSPKPHAPLYIWLRGETEGRATKARY